MRSWRANQGFEEHRQDELIRAPYDGTADFVITVKPGSYDAYASTFGYDPKCMKVSVEYGHSSSMNTNGFTHPRSNSWYSVWQQSGVMPQRLPCAKPRLARPRVTWFELIRWNSAGLPVNTGETEVGSARRTPYENVN